MLIYSIIAIIVFVYSLHSYKSTSINKLRTEEYTECLVGGILWPALFLIMILIYFGVINRK